MGGGDEEILDKILLLDMDPHLSLSPTMLTPVKADGISLNIPRMGDRHDHILFSDEIFDPDLWSDLHNLGVSLISIGISERKEFLFDQIEYQSFACKEGFQPVDQLYRIFIFLHDLALFEVGQSLEPHVQDGLGLF